MNTFAGVAPTPCSVTTGFPELLSSPKSSPATYKAFDRHMDDVWGKGGLNSSNSYLVIPTPKAQSPRTVAAETGAYGAIGTPRTVPTAPKGLPATAEDVMDWSASERCVEILDMEGGWYRRRRTRGGRRQQRKKLMKAIMQANAHPVEENVHDLRALMPPNFMARIQSLFASAVQKGLFSWDNPLSFKGGKELMHWIANGHTSLCPATFTGNVCNRHPSQHPCIYTHDKATPLRGLRSTVQNQSLYEEFVRVYELYRLPTTA